MSTTTTPKSLTQIALEADAAYHAELHRMFGLVAGQARYDARGMSTPVLRRLVDAKIAADAARLAEFYASASIEDGAD